MNLLWSSTFSDAYGKLTSQEQKQVGATAFALHMDPKGNGLQMHRVVSASGFWTVRVNQDLRIVFHQDGDRVLLAYVDHHDAAYRWAERRRLEPHERTGSMQLVEVVERKVERLVYTDRLVEPVAEPITAHRPFASLSDDQLLDVGVPRDWLEPVREAEEASVDGLFKSLPAEAAEALLDYVTGGKLEDHIAPVIEAGADPFTHPDAQRRFRVVDNLEELQAALDQPFEKWAVFLHPVQRELVERNWPGPARVTGSAGTGKTIVALHRAVHLAKRDTAAKVLLTTFSKPLAEALERKRDVLTEAEPHLRKRIVVRPLDQAATELYTKVKGQPNRATTSQIRAFIAEAQKAGIGASFTPEFLFEEWDEVVDAWAVRDADAYATVPRIGRRTRLGPLQREAAWSVFDFVRHRLTERKLVTWPMIYEALTQWLERGGALPFTHFVVDEAQDLTVAQVRFLAQAGKGRADALFTAGDIGQRIFRLPFSWAKLGLDIRGRSHSLKVNYRTSHQIRSMADRLLPPEIVDLDGIEEGRRGTVSVFDGVDPMVFLGSDAEEECAFVAEWLKECLSGGIDPSEIGILVRGDGQLNRARSAIRAAGIDPRADGGVTVCSMHDAKGLEFKAVAVMACDEEVLPDPARLSSIGDESELEAAFETERHLLYVACTRARDRLLVSGVGRGSEFLDDLGWKEAA